MTIERPMFPPVDTTRRRFLTVAAIGSIVGAGSLAFAAAAPNDVPKAVTVPRHSKPDPAFVLIADKLGACLNSRCSIVSESDSSLGYEQVFAPLEYRSDAASAAACAGFRAERPCLAVYR